ncbi:CocE/NonD family hydrolase [Lentzea xinjiangensis]|nr:CocE/NonD family hydrolase [Lentzea xinjiangensis]
MIWMDGLDPAEGGHPGLRTGVVEEEDGVRIERDVPVVLRDGVTVYVDIFRPPLTTDIPAILTLSPYGKHAPKGFHLFPGAGVPGDVISSHTVWEGPDPMWWAKRGYAVVNADSRGSWMSEGDLVVLSEQEGEDGHDLVEWVAERPWCNGKVGMTGVSYLAVVQWRVAATRPPHLAAINPWEGWSDCYREYFFHGGIPETKFVRFTQWSCRCGPGRVEDLPAMHEAHLLLDDYNLSKSVADLSVIDVPAYCVTDWGDHGLHTRGTIEAWREISSEHRWLEVHGRKKWQYYYRPESLRRQLAFFDHFLKAAGDEVGTWPPVRIEVRERYYEGVERAENEWPLARTSYRRYALDAREGRLVPGAAPVEAVTDYDPDAPDGRAVFDLRFDTRTEITGHAKLRLWVETDEGDDMDLFVALQKLDRAGRQVHFPYWSMMDDGQVALGWLRASHRELDEERSTPWQPRLRHERLLPLRPGEREPVEIEIWPSSTLFEAGETVRLVVQGRDVHRYDIGPAQAHEQSVNRGRHRVHTGGTADSHLLLPVVPG